MFEKNMKIALLLDFYGDVLDDRTREIMNAYYEDDLSLSEIAESAGISRQGVRHVIKHGEEQLEFLEARLGLAEKGERVRTAAETILSLAKELSDSSDPSVAEIAGSLTDAANIILEKGV